MSGTPASRTVPSIGRCFIKFVETFACFGKNILLTCGKSFMFCKSHIFCMIKSLSIGTLTDILCLLIYLKIISVLFQN